MTCADGATPTGHAGFRLSFISSRKTLQTEGKGKVKRLCSYTQIPAPRSFHERQCTHGARMGGHYFRLCQQGVETVRLFNRCRVLARGPPCPGTQATKLFDPAINIKASGCISGTSPRNVDHCSAGWLVPRDVQPLPLTSWAGGHSYEQRMEVCQRSAQRCEQCGTTSPKLAVHHPHRLSRLPKRKRGVAHVIASGQEQHVKLLCPACHQTAPSSRRMAWKASVAQVQRFPASWVQRRVARPVLGGDVLQQWSHAPSFDPI